MSCSIRRPLCAVSLIALFVAAGGTAQAQGDPPARVGRLAFTAGSVSFHDVDHTDWSPAVVNTPLTSGDAVWTEPNARSELSVAGTRVRLDGGTQLDMLAIDDSQTRMQVDQGRLDIKTFTFDSKVPYQIVTPRGTITLQQQGDYYVEAGSTEDATRLGVRAGAAQIQSLNGQTLAVRAGEVGEIDGDANAPQLHTVNGAPPAPVAYWATRDRQIGYDAPPQYVSAGMTGYEDLNASGSWSNDSQYGQVWSPRSVPADWQPYRTGHWSNVQPWGWTWIDDQPWGYAPYHYGRWAQRGNRWYWVPPQRDLQPVYAPALVAFIGGVELTVALGNQARAPVGWFPLGPRETYVPSYTADRDYYNRLNRSAEVQQTALDDRWQRVQRHEPAAAGPGTAPVNQRFAIVVPSDTFVRSQPVARAVLKVAPDKIAAAPVAPVSAPPAATASLRANTTAKPVDPKADPNAAAKPAASGSAAPAKTAVVDMPTLGRPTTPEKSTAPGPKIATTTPTASANVEGKQAVPALQPRTGAAPPKLIGATTPATPTTTPAKLGQPDAKPEANKPATTRPEAAKPEATAKPAPAEPPKAASPTPPTQQQARPEPAKPPVEAPKAAPAHEAQPAQPQNKAPEKGAATTPEQAHAPTAAERKPAAPAPARAEEEKKDEKK